MSACALRLAGWLGKAARFFAGGSLCIYFWKLI